MKEVRPDCDKEYDSNRDNAPGPILEIAVCNSGEFEGEKYGEDMFLIQNIKNQQ